MAQVFVADGTLAVLPGSPIEFDSRMRREKLLQNGDTYQRVWINPLGNSTDQGWVMIPPAHAIDLRNVKSIMFETTSEWSVLPRERYGLLIPPGFLGERDDLTVKPVPSPKGV
jgi:hypothetical protein